MKTLFFSLILFVCFGCTESKQVVVAKATNEKGWKEAVSLWYNNEDTVTAREISVMIRYNDRFNGSAVRVGVSIVAPDQKLFRDTLTIHVKKKNRINSFKIEEYYTPIFKNARLRTKGHYCFSISPLNDPPLEGVAGVGILF